MAPFDTPVDPDVRNTTLGSSLSPTRGGLDAAAPSVQPSCMTRIGTPSGSAAACAASATSGCATTRRGASVSSAATASGSVKCGLTGDNVAPALLIP